MKRVYKKIFSYIIPILFMVILAGCEDDELSLNNVDLEAKIAEAIDFLVGKEDGNGKGKYSNHTVKKLQNRIEWAQAILADPAHQKELDNAILILQAGMDDVTDAEILFDAIKLDNTNWKIASQDSYAEGYGPENAIDGDVSTIWHTPWDAGSPSYPHNFVVDLNAQAIVSMVNIIRREGGDESMATSIEISTSTDGINFTSQGTFNYDPADASMMVTFSESVAARYVAYHALEGPQIFTALAEFEVYGQPAISKDSWEITDQNSFASDYEPIFAIDNDINTFWHTDWSEGSPEHPHYIIVDMKETVNISAFICVNRQNATNGPTLISLQTSMDGTNWTSQGDFTFNGASNDAQLYVLPEATEAKYFKYTALEGPDFFTFLAEIDIVSALD